MGVCIKLESDVVPVGYLKVVWWQSNQNRFKTVHSRKVESLFCFFFDFLTLYINLQLPMWMSRSLSINFEWRNSFVTPLYFSVGECLFIAHQSFQKFGIIYRIYWIGTDKKNTSYSKSNSQPKSSYEGIYPSRFA